MNWIVTGSSRGIGAATARMAAARGASVVVNYSVDADGAAAVVASIRAAGGLAIAVQADIAREADVVRLFEAADREFGAPSVLVNNAAITGGVRRVEEVTEELLARVFAVNVTGSFLCAREAVRRMSTRHGGAGGAIVNLTSRAAALGSPNEWVHYAATKGAIDTFTVGLAREVATEGIRVNAIAAGLIETGMHAAAGMPDRVERMAPGIPMQRSASPDEVAEAVLWLASQAASYVTGAILPVAGGR
jgi:NAD(P)-dependent dehydrogenase (short-subunit alcohol dehydrogenase family)